MNGNRAQTAVSMLLRVSIAVGVVMLVGVISSGVGAQLSELSAMNETAAAADERYGAGEWEWMAVECELSCARAPIGLDELRANVSEVLCEAERPLSVKEVALHVRPVAGEVSTHLRSREDVVSHEVNGATSNPFDDMRIYELRPGASVQTGSPGSKCGGEAPR